MHFEDMPKKKIYLFKSTSALTFYEKKISTIKV